MKKGQSKRILKRRDPYFLKKRGKWVAKVYLGNGKYRTRYFDLEDEARDWVAEQWDNRAAGIDGRESVRSVTRKWLEDGKHWKAKTVQDYQDTSEKWMELGDVPVDQLSDTHVQQLLDDIRSPAMRKRVRKCLRTMLNWAVRKKFLRSNPVILTDSVKHETRRIEVFSREEVKEILEAAPDRWRPAIELMLVLALRPGELWGLHWQDLREVDGKSELRVRRNIKEVNGRVVVEEPKTASGKRDLPLPDRAVEILHELRVQAMTKGFASKQHPIISNSSGTHIRHGNFRHKIWNAVLSEAGVEHRSPYTLRHTSATWMLNSGQIPVAVVSRWLGHSNVTTTLKHYSHLIVGEMDQARRFWG